MYQIPKERFEFKINSKKLDDKSKLVIQLHKISDRIAQVKGLNHLEKRFLVNQKDDDLMNDKVTAAIEFHTIPNFKQ